MLWDIQDEGISEGSRKVGGHFKMMEIATHHNNDVWWY